MSGWMVVCLCEIFVHPYGGSVYVYMHMCNSEVILQCSSRSHHFPHLGGDMGP